MARPEGELTDPIAPLAAKEYSDSSIAQEQVRAEQMVAKVRADLAKSAAKADLAEKVYLGEFLPDAEVANSLATALVSGRVDAVPFDAQSLGEHGDDPEAVRAYLQPFQAQDPTREYPFPQLTFPTVAVLSFEGEEHHIENGTMAYYNALSRYNWGPTFTPNIVLPTLVDPQPRTFGELETLESLDPGHAGQLFDAYRMAANEQKDKGGSFQDPHIVRMIAVLPTGYDYATDFVPEVEMKARDAQAWDPRLVVRGELNQAGNYLSFPDSISKHDRVPFNQNGREASLRVRRPLPGSYAEDQAQALVPMAPHELNRMGVILFPYQVHERVRQPDYGIRSGMYGGGGLTFGGGDIFKGATRSAGDIGGADIGIGGAGILGAGKRNETLLGGEIKPQHGGRPLIYSVRLLTAQRSPDKIA